MQNIPDSFKRKMEVDRLCDQKVVKLETIRRRRAIRRECLVYFLGPKGGGPIGGGTPVAMVG